MIRLEEVTPENWRLGLKVAESQKTYVSDDMRQQENSTKRLDLN